MLKVLIVDDEPLVQIGLKSMIDWNALGFEICGTAANGDAAYDMIETYMPEIVITDIQMPCLSGLELAKKCRDNYGRLPVFIILTSYEDFHYAREALSFQAIDYLVKIDLTPELLTNALNSAKEVVESVLNQNSASSADSLDVMLFSERFFIRLLNNLFESPAQYEIQAASLSINLDYRYYCVAQIEIIPNEKCEDSNALYSSTLHMFTELIEKYIDCHIIPLDNRFFAILFYSNEADSKDFSTEIAAALTQTFSMLFGYYSVTLLATVGRTVSDIMDVSASYYDAKQISSYVSADQQIIFFEDLPDTNNLRNVFNLSVFRNDITRAFEDLDESALHETLSGITELLSADNVHVTQAMDVSGSILHLTLTLLSNGAEIADSIFANEPDGYRSLYRQKTISSIINWLNTLEAGLCEEFQTHAKDQKNFLVENVKKYIAKHLHERIALSDLAESFHVSPNYLSQLFKKYTEVGINEYITQQKIAASKELLKQPDLKIYEVAEQFGFESAFYYSKVFKKVTGISPKDFRNHLNENVW